jgi:hypothetical protein
MLIGVSVDPIRDISGIDRQQPLDIESREAAVIGDSHDDASATRIRHGDDVFDQFAPILLRLRIEERLEIDGGRFSIERIEIERLKWAHRLLTTGMEQFITLPRLDEEPPDAHGGFGPVHNH